MYKDLSLKEKAKVIREGVRLGLTSIDDILDLFDKATSSSENRSVILKDEYLHDTGGPLDKLKYWLSANIMEKARKTVIDGNKLKPSSKREGEPYNGMPQATFLLDRPQQKEYFEKYGYFDATDKGYGPLTNYMNKENKERGEIVPVYLTYPDARTDKENLIHIMNDSFGSESYTGPKESAFSDAGEIMNLLYVDPKTGDFYNQAWDYNDYKDITATHKTRPFKGKWDNMFNTLGNVLTKIGSPVVLTTGLQRIPNDGTYYNENLTDFLESKGLRLSIFEEEPDTSYLTLPQIEVKGKAIKKNHNKATGGPTDDLDKSKKRVSNWMRNWYLNRPLQLLDNFDDYEFYDRDLRYPTGRLLNIYNRMGEALDKIDATQASYAPIPSYGMFTTQITNPAIYLQYGQGDSALLHERSHALNEYTGNPEGDDAWSSPFINAIGDITTGDLLGEYDEYLDNLNEIYSRLNQVRYQNNLDPKHKYTLDEIKEMRSKGKLHLKQTDGLERYTDEFIQHLLNDVAYNHKNDSTGNIAAKGGHIGATGMNMSPDWDPNHPYHYHTASGEKVVITPEDWNKHKGLPYFKKVEDAVLTELAAHPGPEYEINSQFSLALRQVYKGNMGPKYQNYSSFSGNLPEGYSFTPEGLISDNQGNLYVLRGFRQTPKFTYDESKPLMLQVLEGNNKGNVTFYPVNMEKTVKPALPVSSTMNVNKERDKAISEYIKDNTTHSTVNETMYKEPYFYPDIDAVDYDWEEWKKEHPVQELRRAVTKDYLYDLIKLKALNHFIFADEEGLEYDPFWSEDEDDANDSYMQEEFDKLFNHYISKPINLVKQKSNITKKPTYAKAKQKAIIEVGPLQVGDVLTYAQGGPIVSPYGQWLFNGKKKKEDTIIPSNSITMEYVDYPVLGISDTGDAKVMMPWNDYKFKGSMVYEHPLIGNQFQLGGNTKPTFDLWYPTVPKQKNDTSSYDLRRAYNTLPFDEMEKFRTIDDYHLPSVAYDEKTDTYTFLKRNGHPTLNYELDWYNSGSPDALEFRERYKLDTLSLPWRYIPRTYLEGGNTLNYLNVPEYNIALYNSVSPLGDFPNFWEALAYKKQVKDKLKNGNIYERDYPVGNTQGEKTAMAAWAKRLGIPYDEQDLPVYNGDTVTLPYSLVLEIPYDTNMLKNRIQLNKALLDKYSKYRYSDVVDAAIKADLYNLDKLRETYKTGKPVGLTEFGWNSRLLVNNGEIVPIENIQSPLNVLGNYNVRYSPEERRLYYSDEYDFNQFENFVPGEPFRIRGYIDLDNNKALGGNLFKKGGIHINPKNKGKFNATKKRTGKTTEELTHSKNPLTRKRAIFAQNAKKWHHKHDEGGYLYSEGGFLLAPYLDVK